MLRKAFYKIQVRAPYPKLQVKRERKCKDLDKLRAITLSWDYM